MRIKVLPVHNRVIATGSYKGKRLKAVAVCNEDNFDEALGIEIAKKKYGIAKCNAKLDLHKKNISALNDMIKWCQNMIDAENKSMAIVETNLDEKLHDFHTFLADKCEN